MISEGTRKPQMSQFTECRRPCLVCVGGQGLFCVTSQALLRAQLLGHGGREGGLVLLMGIQNLNLSYWFKLLRILKSLAMPILKIHILEPNLRDFKIYPVTLPIPLTIEKERVKIELADFGGEPGCSLVFLRCLYYYCPSLWHAAFPHT